MLKQSKIVYKISWIYIYSCIYRMVGFDDFGSSDSFATAALELKLIHAGVLKKKEESIQNVQKSIFQSNDTDSELDDE